MNAGSTGEVNLSLPTSLLVLSINHLFMQSGPLVLLLFTLYVLDHFERFLCSIV